MYYGLFCSYAIGCILLFFVHWCYCVSLCFILHPIGHALENLGFPHVHHLLLLLAADEVQLLLNISLDIVRASGGVVTADWFALRVDEEFLKVPCDIVLLDGSEVVALRVTHHKLGAGTRSLKEAEQFLLSCPVTICLCRETEIGFVSISGADVFKGGWDLGVRSWFLEPELVGGDGQKIKVGVVDIGFDCIPNNILLGEPSVCC